jgi:hydrogenase large subunit
MRKITINPLTRTHGYFSVELEIRDGRVSDARASGLLFRGFEQMLQGRAPHDAVYLTQRICGICSSAHAITGALALEDAFRIEVPQQAYLLRNLIFGADTLQNHIRFLYLLVFPDYVDAPPGAPGGAVRRSDYRLPKAVRERIQQHYLEALETSGMAHKAVAVFGGKAPHLQTIVAGGVTEKIVADKVTRFQSLLSHLDKFIRDKLLPDIEDISRYYADYFAFGKGYGNLLSFGQYRVGAKGAGRVFPAGAVRFGQEAEPFQPLLITREIAHSWYHGREGQLTTVQGKSQPAPHKETGYSWIKAPRYKELPFEGGPLARLWLAGIYRNGISVLDRLMARALEAKEVAVRMNEWLRELVPGSPTINWLDPLPASGEGTGLADSMRGPLAHWLQSENGRLAVYRIVTPSAWNLSPRDGQGRRGPLEEALIGTPVADADNPVEAGRVIRSFDPCISCAVHVLQRDGSSRLWRQI